MKPTTALELAAFGQCPSQARASGDPDEDGHLGRRGPRLAGERRRPNLEWVEWTAGETKPTVTPSARPRRERNMTLACHTTRQAKAPEAHRPRRVPDRVSAVAARTP